MPYPASAIANEFIGLAQESGKPITPMKLQKLVYFAHGWYLALTGEPLINEPVQAWRFGPVIPSLYHSLKIYGNSPISKRIPSDSFGGSGEPSIDDGPDTEENAAVHQLIKRIWDLYGAYSSAQLSNLTHLPDSPWSQTPDKDRRNTEIKQEEIRSYFSAQVRR